MGTITAERFLEEVYNPHRQKIYELAFSMVHCPEHAHDITQEAFGKALKGLNRFKGDSSLYTWLYRIAWNVACDWLRKQKQGPFSNSAVDFNEAAIGIHDLFCPQPDPLRRLFSQQILKVQTETLAKCRPRQAAIFKMRMDGFKMKEIADELKTEEDTVRNSFFRIRQKMRFNMRLAGLHA